MVAVPPLALLLIVTVPVSLPAAVGSNFRSSVADCPGDNVTGVVTPDIVNPVPLIDAALMFSDAVPLEVSCTVCVAGVFTLTLPKATLDEPSFRDAVALLPGLSFSE